MEVALGRDPDDVNTVIVASCSYLVLNLDCVVVVMCCSCIPGCDLSNQDLHVSSYGDVLVLMIVIDPRHCILDNMAFGVSRLGKFTRTNCVFLGRLIVIDFIVDYEASSSFCYTFLS